jgi:UDP-2-acetamido-3-amino-2,3-dideoxy-glucuronate N-acetyltransferase
MEPSVHPTAIVEETAVVGSGTVVWDLARLREGATVGENCVIGRGAYVDRDVQIGDGCKIQNQALIYWPAQLGCGVFVGPGVILTNDRNPRAVQPDFQRKQDGDWEAAGVSVREGASIGAGAVVLGGVIVGRWALVGAGAVVTSDVPDYALVMGNPARRVGWVGPSGHRLEPDGGGQWRCPVTGERFRERATNLEAVP